jgi:hypothetical protein
MAYGRLAARVEIEKRVRSELYLCRPVRWCFVKLSVQSLIYFFANYKCCLVPVEENQNYVVLSLWLKASPCSGRRMFAVEMLRSRLHTYRSWRIRPETHNASHRFAHCLLGWLTVRMLTLVSRSYILYLFGFWRIILKGVELLSSLPDMWRTIVVLWLRLHWEGGKKGMKYHSSVPVTQQLGAKCNKEAFRL